MHSFFSRTWFPLALLGLFLAAIPGVVLVILAVVNLDGPVNAWLRENLQITYQLTLAAPLVLLLLCIPPAIILLYFLKLKRKPIQVPSTFLWRKSIEDLHVNALLQWLRQNLLLVLQLLAMLFMIYSVLGLRFHGASSEGEHYILLIDNSASMSATDVATNRLHAAKQEALRLIDAAGDNDYGMVIAFNSKASTLQAYTNNRIKLREAVRSIEQTYRVTRLEEALTLIDGLANPVRSTEDQAVRQDSPGQERTFVQPKGIKTTVHFFSDGRFAKIPEAALANLNSRQAGNTSLFGNLQLQYHPAGKNSPGNANNLGIVSISAVRSGLAGNERSQAMEALVRVQNFSDRKKTVALRLDVLVDGKLADTQQRLLDLEPRTFLKADAESGEPDKDVPGEDRNKGSSLFKLPADLDPKGNVVLHAVLDNHHDDFAVDDEAWFVLGTLRKAKVVIVGPKNVVLDAFFEQPATQKVVSAEQMSREDLDTEAYRKLARSGDVDLVIFDRCAPAEEIDLPQANAFFIDAVPPPWKKAGKTLKNPYMVVASPNHAFLRRITSLWDVGVAEAFALDPRKDLSEAALKQMELPETDPNRRVLPALKRLVEASGAVPLVFTVPRGAYSDLVMTFALVDEKGNLNTNWPLQPSFPLFILNVVNTLGNVEDAARIQMVQPGETVLLRPEAGVQTLTITSPAGASTVLKRGARADFVYADTEKPGIYQVQRDDGVQRSLAVNLLDTNESTIDPRTELKFGQDDTVEAGKEAIHQPQELWKWILVVALVLLVAEWFFYTQRVSI